MKTSAKSIDNANKALFFLLFSLFKFFEAVEQQTIPIRTKANKIYAMKTQNKLFPNYDSITCDFKLLESKAKQYK